MAGATEVMRHSVRGLMIAMNNRPTAVLLARTRATETVQAKIDTAGGSSVTGP